MAAGDINQVVGGFQSSIGLSLSEGFQGDFASTNPIISYPVGQGGVVAGDTVTIGSFVWLLNDPEANDPYFAGLTVVSNATAHSLTGHPIGIIPRALQGGYITNPTSSYGNSIQAGQPAVPVTASGVYFTAGNSTAAVAGQKVFAQLANGANVTTGAGGSTISGYVETNWIVTKGCSAGELFIAAALTPVSAGTNSTII